MRDVRIRLSHQQERASRAHPMEGRIRAGLAVDRCVGALDRALETLGPDPGTLLRVLRDRLHRHARGDVTREMTAHPVRHREERFLDQVRVFVAVANATDIGLGADAWLHLRISRTVLPILTWSPRCSSTC